MNINLNEPLKLEIRMEQIDNGTVDVTRTASLSTINQIANKLASSKALLNNSNSNIKIELDNALSQNGANQSQPSMINKIADKLAGNCNSNNKASPTIAEMLTNNTSPNFKSTDPDNTHPVVSKMTEALSLKQSPTLTKQLTTPVSGDGDKMQVITQYMCRYCGQQFDSPTVMQQHIQDHVQGKTPHQCSVCGKEYRTPSKLQRHVRVHSGERPYPCSVCGRRFTRSDHVKQHMKVHYQPKDLNICHLCNEMKFNRRQALHQHLQQQHLIQQVFTCHHCGEAYESLEEMQTHKLTHDAVLNSMKDSLGLTDPPKGVAKFTLSQQKGDNLPPLTRYDHVKSEKTLPELKPMPTMDMNNGYFIPANLDNVTALSNNLILEGMEKMAKEAAEAEINKKYRNELIQLNEDAMKFQQQSMEVDRTKDKEEQAKIAACFNIKAASPSPKPSEENGAQAESDTLRQGTTMLSADGMSMFILPPSKMDNGIDNSLDNDFSEMEEDITDNEQNSSKESAGINREGDMEQMDNEEGSKLIMDETIIAGKSKSDENGELSMEERISPRSPAKGYTRPCPKSKKPGYIAPTIQECGATSNSTMNSILSKPLYPLNQNLSDLIKAKCEQNINQAQPTVTSLLTGSAVTNKPATILVGGQSLFNTNQPKIQNILPTSNLAFVSNPSSMNFGSLQSILVPINNQTTSSTATSLLMASVAGVGTKPKQESPRKMQRCEHCCIWFEDNAMSLLHNTLHAADEADPFTCRKCYKKLGNRLEFMAHIVWHLEPNMDI